MPDNDIIIDNATIDRATWFDGHILANIYWGGKAMGKSAGSIDDSTISNGREMPDSHWVVFSSDNHIVPNGSIFAYNNFSNYSKLNSLWLFLLKEAFGATQAVWTSGMLS